MSRRRGWAFHYIERLPEAADAARASGLGCVVHLHQLDNFYVAATDREAVLRARSLVETVEGIRAGGAAIVHTFHNRRRHDGRFAEAEAIAVQGVGEHVDLFLTRCAAAARHVAGLGFPASVRVVPQPAFVGVYGPPCERLAARRALSLADDDVIFLMVGDLKPYKEHALVIDAFTALGLPRGKLVITGGHGPAEYAARLSDRAATAGAPVQIVPGALPDATMPAWLGASDVVVYGFREILWSSSVMLALSYGTPVIVPNVGCLGELVSEGCNGFLYDAGSTDSLRDAMLRSVADPRPSPSDIRGTLDEFALGRTVELLAAAYHYAADARRGADD